MKILSFDIGGTKIAYALINENGNLSNAVQKISTPKTKEKIEQTLQNIISQYEYEIDAVAIATAGVVNAENTKIEFPPANMPEGYSLIDFMSLSDKPVFIENDANSVALAEHLAGSAQGSKHAIVVAIGTGLGLGIIIDGKILKGKSGAAGEGHYPINLGNKRLCSCGAYDCWEMYASGKALALDAQETFKNPQMTTYELIRLKNNGNILAQQAFDQWCRDIISGLRGLSTLFDPEVIVLFGSLVEYLDIKKMEQVANKNLVVPPFKLAKAYFGNNAALIGAALLAVHKLTTDNQKQPV